MRGISVEKKNALKAKKMLKERHLLLQNFKFAHRSEKVIMPVAAFPKSLPFPFETVNVKFKERRAESLRGILKNKLSQKELPLVRRSFDLLGNIAIIEIPDELKKKRKVIANALIKTHPTIKTVFMKTGPTSGDFRTRPLEFVAGEKNYIAHYRESGCIFEFDVSKVFFSPRLSFERSRITSLVKKKENILALFAGVGPFPIIIAKHKPDTEITAVELNPDAAKFLRRNARLNKVKINIIEGDVAKVLPGKFRHIDRAVMPLPFKAHSFLEYVIPTMKKGGTIHLYGFGNVETPFKELENIAKSECEKQQRKYKKVFCRIVKPYSPSTVEVVLDFKVI